MHSRPHRSAAFDTALAWYFVVVWGSGYLATKIGLQYAAPFTFLTLRYAFGILCLAAIVVVVRPAFPTSRRELAHLAVAGLLMHAINLGGSHYAQYLGLSAGITALVLSLQPVLTAVVAWRWLREPLAGAQWLGVAMGLAGVALVVAHKIDIQAVTLGAVVAVLISLASVTSGTLYQRVFCPHANLWAGALLQFALSLAVLAPLAWAFEGLRIDWSWPMAGAIAFLVIFASILAVNALHTLMRHGEATKVTSLLYLTPIIAVALEYALFGVAPTALAWVGIVVTSAGVALVAWRRRA
ncbi:MAG: DMT family transporter [Burkholderiales bacterium]|jgi:drug/metabolite transporter (DMT)-like permease|nr:DMT family transporter [Burkholderiales bacterium]